MKPIGTRYQAPAGADEREPAVDLTSYLDLLARYRRTFLSVAGVIIGLGLIYAILAKPVYRTDMTVQVEDSSGNSIGKLAAGVSPAFDVKPAASAEIELLRSRMVVGKAVDDLRLYIEAAPRYFPLIGPAIANFNPELSHPGLFGWGGFAWGHESITVAQLDVPAPMEERKITLTALGDDAYRVRFASDNVEATGKVGSPLTISTATGTVTMLVSQIDGRPGVQFVLRRLPRGAAITRLQEKLAISERGKQSGVIGMSLEGISPDMTAAVLNEIGNAYVDQNIRRKAAEAEKSLAFLEGQLPLLRQQVDVAETRYNAMRNQRGTIDLSEESKLILGQSVQIQTKLQELQQKRQELAARFTSNHPAIALIDNQIAGLNGQLNGVSGRIQKLPDVEQNVLRLMRDVKVSTELLQTLLNEVQQLKLVKASKVGTARIVDPADVPLKPVRPDRAMIAGMSLALGLLAGLLAIFMRHMLDGGVADADEIERQTGMTVYSTIPFSKQQSELPSGGNLLALQQPDDPAVESLRSFRTALRFAMAGSNSRTVMITGPAPGVGKSFVCANFAAIAAAGSRVVLIDADLRRGSLQSLFDARRGPGLTELLMGAPLEQVLQRQVAPGLDFISTGTQPPHAADLLLTSSIDSLLEQLKSRYDLVLIDTPPVLAAADASILASKAGVVFLVARAEKTTTDELIAAQRAIQQAGADIKGVLFNGLLIEGRWYRSHNYFGKYRYLAEYGNGQSKRA
ncbi:polysaccharide biosynthesis tyrosine autokinase [Cupriavidus necator H16]|uniref:Putative tyrosine-protein kinase EpsB n=1 Tax=Cupriavidus necator (strain ATCC 17699 / DSM 428 / KCTC 22496 / NCIMB 10442 / H16 / Stanier 337) TaxID=381666 RepID=A0AAE5ZG85_CUPNH|nr:polysaccharide biosynthesis tyrosine autokinase [Cupriavidus necator]QCC02776.1 polysaccharide biosynthesis tyrosine autokinase [Cupriavidus necator H16]WKA44077.1 polysaccharide biosynthesis tyrosine autokinase [Cupriavidus necator]